MRTIREMAMDAPIPGSSLTAEPGNYPWERPPQMNDVDEIADYYLSRLNTPDAIDDILDLVELEVPIEAIAGALVTNNVSKGLHTVDTGILIGPVVHQFIRTVAEDAGVTFIDNLDPDRQRAKKQKEKLHMKMKLKLAEMKKQNLKGDPGMKLLEEMSTASVEEPMPVEEPAVEEEVAAPAPRGLMSRSV
jgi:hypothetical protein